MPPRRRFDKKNATTFSVVHRGHDDELYFDNDASRHVLVPVNQKQGIKEEKQQQKIKTTEELEKDLGEGAKTVRDNEGLAAQYGIFYDDSKYDYMQHLKPIGEAEDAIFIAKKDSKTKPKKVDLFEELKDQLPSENTKVITQADMENIPAELQGFNPNLDPRLREALEALEDEAYIEETEDGDIDDFFNNIVKSGEADDFDGEFDDDDYDEWDMDNYDDEYNKYDQEPEEPEEYPDEELEEHERPYNEGEAPEDVAETVVISTGWEKDFEKFKKNHHNSDDSDNFDSDDDFGSEEEDTVAELGGPKTKKVSKTKLRKKKGAMTDTSAFSMSSSAVFRTEGLTLLDDRYEVLSKKFEQIDEDDEEEDHPEFNMEEERGDFESMLDDFLDNYELERGGRKLTKKNEEAKRIQTTAASVTKSKKAPKHPLAASFTNLSLN